MPAHPASRDHRPEVPARRRLFPAPLRWAAPLLDPTPAIMRRIALAGIVANAGIIMTGAAVRLSKSGLGCPDWPQCTRNSLVAAPTRGDPMFHTWIEFGNRTLTGLLMVIAVVVLVAAWQFRPAGRRRRDLVWLAAGQPAGVVAQAVLGGIVVLTNLNPAWVSVHFMVSIAVVGIATALYVRCREGTGPARSLVRIDQRIMARGLVALVALMLAAGTVVTGTGPLAGAGRVPRYHLPLEGVTQAHADIGWALGMLAALLALSLQLTSAPQQNARQGWLDWLTFVVVGMHGSRLTGVSQRAARLGWVMFFLVLAQGAIGYSQYFSGLPAGLVWVHVSDSVLIWIVALLLMFATRDRGPVTEAAAGAASEAAAAPAGHTRPVAATPAR